MTNTVGRQATAECIGTAMLLAAVVGSGIMGDRLAGGNVAIALLANMIATGAALVALTLTFGPVSGAHFNPAVTLADASQGGLPWNRVPPPRCCFDGWCRRCRILPTASLFHKRTHTQGGVVCHGRVDHAHRAV